MASQTKHLTPPTCPYICAAFLPCTADTHGNVACFSIGGEELWMRHVKSLVAQGPTAGDINSDGKIEVSRGT